jgi:rod shape-determining protein MreC
MPAIAVGRGDGAVDVRSVAAADVRFGAGDAFVTSGTGGLYAPGIPVARIERAGLDSVVGRTFAQPDTFDVALVSRVFVPMPPAAPAPPPPVGTSVEATTPAR